MSMKHTYKFSKPVFTLYHRIYFLKIKYSFSPDFPWFQSSGNTRDIELQINMHVVGLWVEAKIYTRA